MPRSTRELIVAVLVGLAAGAAITALLFSYPKSVVARHRYCLDCAAFEETYDEHVVLGATHSQRLDHGPLGSLLGNAPGTEHEHRFTEWTTIFPTFGAPAEHPELARRVTSIRQLEKDAHAISLLEQAVRNDRGRGTRLIQRLIAADSAVMPAVMPAVIRALDRDAPWPERWAAVEAMAVGQ
jgi:hypothetical protein